MSKLVIKKSDLFHTPSDMGEILDWIEKHNGAEKVHLYTLHGMLVNFFSELVASHNEFGGDSVSTGDEPEPDVKLVNIVLSIMNAKYDDSYDRRTAERIVKELT